MYTVRNKKVPLLLRLVCGVFFASFSFVYLFCMQGDLLAYAQYVYSNGVTRYSILVGALVITLLLMIVQWCVARLLRLGTNYYALSYTIPALFLAILTSVNVRVIRDFSFGAWTWLLPLAVVLYVVLVKVLNKYDSVRCKPSVQTFARPLWINAAIHLALMLMTGSVANSYDVLHYELKTERLITEGRYEDAVRVAKKSLVSSRRLTELRMYALARQGELGNRMFEFPQYYGVNGLLDVADTSAVFYRVDASDVCRYLGVGCGANVKSTKRYLHLASNHISSCANPVHVKSGHAQRLMDYSRAYMLLDKDLDAFCESLAVDSAFTLPKSYQEALMICDTLGLDNYVALTGKSSIAIDSIVLARFAEYNVMKEDLKDATERKNRLRRKFGNTYWWYYEYAD